MNKQTLDDWKALVSEQLIKPCGLTNELPDVLYIELYKGKITGQKFLYLAIDANSEQAAASRFLPRHKPALSNQRN